MNEAPPVGTITAGGYSVRATVAGPIMADILTRRDIEAQFSGEWILLEDPQTDEHLTVQSGKVLAHSKDRDEVYRQLVALRPKRFAMLYAGKESPDKHYVL
jgi:hypothetical protein